MAVAVKNSPDVRNPSLLDRMPVLSLIGAVYVIGCVGVVGKVLPYLWWEVIGFDETGMTASILLLMVLAAVVAGLGYLGFSAPRLLGTHAPAGTRAGIFVAVLGILLILLLTRWASLWIEYWVFFGHWFGPSGVTAGAVMTAAIFVVLLGAGVYFFMDRRFERYLVRLDDQGWFSGAAYKGLQGIKVRRGTILGVLLVVGAGIYTLLQRGTLQRGPESYEIDIPFTGKLLLTNASLGDAATELAKHVPAGDWDEANNKLRHPVWMNRYQLRDINDALGQYVKITDQGGSVLFQDKQIVRVPDFKAEVESVTDKSLSPPTAGPLTPAGGDEVSNYVRIKTAGDSTNPDIKPGAIVPMSEFNDEENKLKGTTPANEGTPVAAQPTGKPPTAVPVALARGTEVFSSITLLPAVQYTVPLLLIAVALWFAWRLVNFPAFADFLIATEAELNKVSWATRRRLVQDTIVVLITVFLMAVFLFAMDQTWSFLLSWDRIGVIQLPPKEQKQPENRPY